MSSFLEERSSERAEVFRITDDFIQHWARNRIDQPGKIMSDHDNAARQLIALSGFLQAVYLGVFTFSRAREHVPVAVVVVLLLPLLCVVFFAAKVICTIPTDMNVHATFQLLRDVASGKRGLQDVDEGIFAWCDKFDVLAQKKIRWLHWANIAFLTASLVTVGLLAFLMMM
jgi:hypothetical protein